MSDLNALPSAEEAFPAVPTAEEAFPQYKDAWRLDGEFFDRLYSDVSQPATKILDAFGAGVKHGWGARPLGDYAEGSWVKQAKELGLFNDYDKSRNSWIKQFNESLLRGTAVLADTAIRAPMAAFYGVSGAAVEAGLSREIPALVEAFPFGRATGLPSRIHPQIEIARDLGVIGREPSVVAREAFAPEGVERPTERVQEPVSSAPEVSRTEIAPEQPVPQPGDAHTIARMITPETFREYDALAEQKGTLWDFLQETKAERDAPVQARIDDILSKVNNVETRLMNRAALRLELARKELEDIQAVDSPAMAQARQALMETDFRMRDLAPEVSEAYREAHRQLPVEEIVQKLEPVAESAGAEIIPFEARVQEAAVPVIENLAQRRATIARDVEQKLIAAGRGIVEARMSAALVQAHYEARAARFNGALGRAHDLYDAEGPIITREIGGARRGSLNLATNTIRLFRDSDASTFIHETGHSWLEEMRRDNEHPAAPSDLKADFQTVKDWLGAGETLTRAQHERFARGFERYLMEGQAPTSRLAQVFEKFKQWLTQIYQTVSRLRAPITNDIRGVYDRLISTPNREPIIIPEREGAVDFATAAEQAARETPAANALDAADRIRDDRERVAQILSKAVDDVRREARRGPTGIRVPEPEGTGGKPVGEGAGAVKADDAIDTGRNPPTGKSKAPAAGRDFDPVDGDLVDKAGNIRVDNLNVAEDVGAAIREAAAHDSGFLTARRGTLTDAEVLNLADDLGMSANKLDRRRIGEAFNAEEIVAARKLLVQSATEVRDAMGRAAVGAEEGIIEYALARERHLMIQEQVAGITAEAGRALRAFKDMEGFKAAGMLSDLFQKTIKLTPEQLQHEAEMGLRLDNTPKLNKFLRDRSQATWKDMVVEAWINALLSGPYTHVRNMIGNTTVAVNSVMETAGAAAVGKLRGSDAVQFAEVMDRVHGFAQGSQEGIIAFGKAIKDENFAFRFDAERANEGRRQSIPGGIGKGVRLPGRFLAAEDELFKAIAFQQEVNVRVRRTARAEGLEGSAFEARVVDLLRDLPEDIIAAATERARYQTFTNQLGPLGQRWLAFADAHPLVRLVVPFSRTPINIVKYAGERTPFGLLSRHVRDNLMGRHGEIARDTQIARLALGSMLMTTVATLVLSDSEFITGGGPADPEENATWRRRGRLPYSVGIGSLRVSFRGIDPISIPLAAAADLAEIARSPLVEGKEIEKVAQMLVAAVSRDLIDKLPVRGVADLLMAVRDPQQFGQRWLNQVTGSLVPAGIAQTTQMDDPVYREARTILDTLKARAGLGFLVEERRDLWGEPISRTDIGPFQTARWNDDPVNKEMDRLRLGVGKAARKIDEVELTPGQYSDYARVSGRFAKQMLDDMMEQSWYQNLPDGVKKQVVHKTIEDARDLGRKSVQMESIGGTDDLVQKGIVKELEVLK